MAKIAVDAGHGVSPAGNGFKETPKPVPKYGRIVKEYEFNKPTAQYLKEALERQGHTVVWTGADYPSPNGPALSARCQKANAAGCDLFISIHYNAGGGHGVETYIYGRGGNAEKLAKQVQPELVKVRNQLDRGVKVANFAVLRETKMPAILCECGFMDDPRGIEQGWMLDKAFQKGVAEAICKGVQDYYGKPYKAPVASQPAPKPAPQPATKDQAPDGTFYRVVAGSFKDRAGAEARVKALKAKGFDSFIDVYKA
jgi:N-acetylmuramoyl-L-alanine amidase